ncbi:hypothetical protein C0Q70_17828 [Pomacea canaliculata]|uniref:B box-type domain-containing protein n=2 Tax=Pomacea canaliculata TaxID=400727 RepID=A0A2T7NLJ2_POMCA|nr:hypothetical protein C0Q70_17828 [Pomacea canaliculata]
MMKIENVVNNLPTDYMMEALVQSARVLSKDPVCSTCDANNKAEFICMQCLDMMCSSCHKIHKKMSVSRSHDVESLSSVTPERLAASGPPLCADHGDKQFLFCQDHGLALCASCKDERHSQCQAVNKLDDEMISAKKSLDTLIDQVTKEEEKLKKEIAEMDSLVKDVDISRHEDMAQIDKACDRLQILVEEFCINMKRQSEASHNSSKQNLCRNKNRCSEKLASVTSHKRIIFKAKEVSPRPALIHLAKALTNRVNYVENSYHQFMTPSRVGTSCEDMVRKIEEMLNKSLMY